MKVSRKAFHVTKPTKEVEHFPKGFPRDDMPSELDGLYSEGCFEDGELGEDVFLESYSVVELKQIASDEDIDLTGARKKHDIIDRIIAAKGDGVSDLAPEDGEEPAEEDSDDDAADD